MQWSYEQNVKQLSSEVHAKSRGEDNHRMAKCRERQARREIERLRKFAMLKPGRVQDNVLGIVVEMELALEEALQ